ncbi:hypothetical protein LINPERHAP1_LOCUS15395 [Linum perenne]
MSASHTKSAVSCDGADFLSSTDYNLEFHCMTDDAWYNVCAIFDHNKLTVKYEGFDDADDDLFEPQRFSSLAQIEEFKSRFRPISHQLQDWECLKLTKGMTVCVSHSFNDNDNLFYDGAIDDVIRKKHSFVNGEERCMCRFVVVWTHGPVKGQWHTKQIENICIVQSDSELDPAVASFLEVARQHREGNVDVKVQSRNELEILHLPLLGTQSSPSTSFESFYLVPFIFSLNFGMIILETESSGDDADIGGRYAILIENMEIGISPSTLEQFIKEQISVLVETHALGSLFHETSTRAVIVVKSEQEYQQLCNFLDSPAHFVTCWTGRPLVVTDKSLGRSQTNYGQSKWQHRRYDREEEDGHGIKLVRSGSDAYRRAEKLRELFMDFKEHQKVMYKSLSEIEDEIKQRFLSM